MWKCVGREGECQIQFLMNSINSFPNIMFVCAPSGTGRPELQIFNGVWFLYRRWD